jgi:hypothetical protein
MKKIVLLLMLSMCVYLAFASGQANVPVDYKQAFAITQKQADHMDISFTLPQFEIEEVEQGSTVYHRIVMPEVGTTLESGLPELPTISMSVAIPRRGGVQVQALSTQQNLITQFHAYPVQQGQDLEAPKSFVINADFYANGESYPAAVVQYSDPVILRDFRIINVQVNPFSYDPQTQELTVSSNIEFRINYTSEPGFNELEGELLSVSPAFSRIYESMILNFDDYRNLMYSNTPPRYLLIYGNNTDQNYINAINEFVLWKKQKGADVDIASTASNEAGSSTTTIKNYIQNAYNNVATRPDYVILLGDTSGSYTIPTYTVSGGVGDYPYTHLAGNDGLGDVFIGRISAENLSQVQLLFAKTYIYERDINLATAQWLNRMLLVGDWSPSGISTVYTSKYIKERALYTNPNYTFTELYSDNPSASLANTAITQGIGFHSYRGYIGMSGWSPSASSLNNGFRLPHAIILTCGTGNFGSTATTEDYIRLGTPAQPKGAVTAMGMATSSTHTVFNNALHGGVWGGIFQFNMRTPGEAMLNGKLHINQIFGVSSPSNATSFAHWLNLMGDPTMEMFTGIPNHFDVTVQASIPLGLSLLDIAVRDSTMMVIEGASVTLTQNGAIISRGYTDAEGNVILVLPSGMTATSCILTVSKHEFKPLQQTIEVVNTGTLVPGTIVIDDDNSGASSGNSDGLVNGGETLEVNFGLNNTGTGAIAGIAGYITSTNPYVTFVDSLVTYGTINGGQLGFNQNPVVMEIAPDAPHAMMLRLHLILTDTETENYDVSEFIVTHNAKMMVNAFNVTNGGNQALDPGETAGFTITVSNLTPTGVSGIYGKLYTLNDLVSVTDNEAYYGDLLQNVQVTPATDFFELYARPLVLPGMIIPMQLKLYNDAGFVQWLDLSLTVGVVDVNDPLGPDTYGYVIYDDQDTGYDLCPVYDWVGIAPAEGGVGTALAISDAYTSSDEGDQVGADALETVNLPFPFQFYGVSYNQVTVSSNGFIAFGVTENPEFRNYRIPGPMGPNPMIAAFWDDLATTPGSGIYTWFDRNNHAFVIEWYNLKNGYNGTSPETFQIILYDPSVHATSLGDGPIKIQYHTFNNVSASASTQNHGCFSTIGIEDHSGLVGLEYTFNNQYPTAASQLGNQRAIYITNIPIYYESAQVILGETYIDDQNGNGVCEPGETIELGVQLENIGNAVAENLNATLTTDNEYITIINGASEYFPLAGESLGVNRTPFIFQVDPECPDGTVVNFSLAVVSGEYAWNRPFSIRVDASLLEYQSFMINDADSNYNGVIDPLETVQLVVNVRNSSAVRANHVLATLSSSSPDVTIAQPIVMQDKIEANHVMQLIYELQFTGTAGVGTYIPFQFNASLDNGLPLTATLMVPYNMANIFSDFETENGNFQSETGWAWGTPAQVTPYSGTKLWATNLTGTYPDNVNYHLYTPVYALETGSVLSFRHTFGVESGYDGVNVGVSTNNGDSWSIITPVGGYPYQSLNGLNGEPGYSGSSGWQQATFTLGQYTGQQVMFRFRLGSDGNTGGIGWFIDNFELTNVNQKTGYLHGIVIPTSSTSPAEAVVKANNFYATNPDGEGSFRLYLPNGMFSATASLQYHQSSTVNQVQISPASPTHYTEFTLINLPPVQGADFTVDNETGLVTLSWNEPFDPVLPIMGYNVYKKFDTGPFEMIQQTTGLSHSENITLYGHYRYYICARYMNTEGSPSDTLDFMYPYVADQENEIPGLVTKLNYNYPNPFNPTTTISFDLAQPGKVKLCVYNVKGQLVKTLINGQYIPGKHRIVWDGRDNSNRGVASGVYFYRLQTKGYTQTRKMLMLK